MGSIHSGIQAENFDGTSTFPSPFPDRTSLSSRDFKAAVNGTWKDNSKRNEVLRNSNLAEGSDGGNEDERPKSADARLSKESSEYLDRHHGVVNGVVNEHGVHQMQHDVGHQPSSNPPNSIQRTVTANSSQGSNPSFEMVGLHQESVLSKDVSSSSTSGETGSGSSSSFQGSSGEEGSSCEGSSCEGSSCEASSGSSSARESDAYARESDVGGFINNQ